MFRVRLVFGLGLRFYDWISPSGPKPTDRHTFPACSLVFMGRTTCSQTLRSVHGRTDTPLRGSRPYVRFRVVTSSFMSVMVEITLVTTFLDTEECNYN